MFRFALGWEVNCKTHVALTRTHSQFPMCRCSLTELGGRSTRSIGPETGYFYPPASEGRRCVQQAQVPSLKYTGLAKSFMSHFRCFLVESWFMACVRTCLSARHPLAAGRSNGYTCRPPNLNALFSFESPPGVPELAARELLQEKRGKTPPDIRRGAATQNQAKRTFSGAAMKRAGW